MSVRDAIFLPLAALAVGQNMYYRDLEPSDFKYTYGALLGFYTIELCVSKLTPDYLIHHSMGLYFIAYDWFCPYNTAFRTAVLNVEIPSMIWTIVPYLPASFQTPANLLFVGLFVKTRIVDIYPFLTMEFANLNFVLWCFYLLNLYWGFIIVRKLTKPFLSGKSLIHVTDIVCSFTMAASFAFHVRYESFFSSLAHGSLAITSFNVHWFFSNVNSLWWVADIIAMHMVCVTKHHSGFGLIPNIYTFLSYGFHAGVVAVRIYHIQHYTLPLSMLPMFFDGMLTIGQFEEKAQIAVIMTGVCIAFTEKIKPFYDLSFVAVHGLIIWCIHLYLTSPKFSPLGI